MNKLLSIVYPYLQKLKYARLLRLFRSACRYPVEQHSILMLSTAKDVLGGNLLAIKQYIERHALNYEIKVVTGAQMPPLSELARALAVSEFILVDDYEPMVYVLALRKNQHLVQVWHAMGAFKKFGYARETAEQHSLTHKNYTEVICSAPALTKIYAQSFGIDECKVKPVGTPRTDCFFDATYVAAVKERLYAQEPALRGKKICLFAPTFRGNNVHNGYYPAEYMDFAALSAALGEDWAIVVKWHPFIKTMPDTTAPRVYDFSEEREINELLFITDVLITDYSSVIFENAVIGNAAVLYAPDLEEYISQRGFYFAYEDYACGDVVAGQAALAEAIKNASTDDERMKQFQRSVSLCDGHATERFIKTILEEK